MKSTLALLSLAAIANASGYVEFCESFDKGEAKDGCGKAVATQNNGCLKESGRHSLHFTESDGSLYYPVMVAYYDDNCQKEKGCNALGMGGTELDISFDQQQWKFAEGALSYKFIHGGASPPSCPNGCVGQCGDAPASRVMRARDEEVVEQIQESLAVNETEFEKRQRGNNFWFCDDENCSQNCGNHIEPHTAGCANKEYGRKSVFMKGLGEYNDKSANLAAYDNNDCSGNPVTTLNVPNGCTKLPSQHEGWNVIGFNF